MQLVIIPSARVLLLLDRCRVPVWCESKCLIESNSSEFESIQPNRDESTEWNNQTRQRSLEGEQYKRWDEWCCRIGTYWMTCNSYRCRQFCWSLLISHFLFSSNSFLSNHLLAPSITTLSYFIHPTHLSPSLSSLACTVSNIGVQFKIPHKWTWTGEKENKQLLKRCETFQIKRQIDRTCEI